MSFIRSFRGVAYFLFLSTLGCNSSGINGHTTVAQGTIYQHYSIIYHEGSEQMQVYAQFRSAGNKGAPILLTPPANIQFDDSLLNVDASTEGTFYVQQLSIEDIYGEHRFVFTDMSKKKYENDFSFDEFRIVALPMEAPTDQPLNVEFQTSPLQSSDYIQISPVETDSSFSITYSGADTAKYITIPPAELQKLKPGQTKFVATLYRRIPLKEATPGGGYIEIMYVLKPVYINLLQ